MTPPMTIAHSGRAEGGFRSEGAPWGAIHRPPLMPPSPPRRARDSDRTHRPGGSAPTTRGGPGKGSAGRPPEGEQGGSGATPPPPATRKQRGPRPPPPEAAGMVPPPPAGERSRSTARPPAQAASSHRNCGEQASPRQRARTPHRSGPVKAGEHEPEWYGDHAPHDQNDASDTCFVACPGNAEGQNEAERTPALQPPPAAQTGGTAHGPPPPPAGPPAHERHGGAPRGAHSPTPGRGTASHHPRGTQPPQSVQARGTVWGPHTHTPAPTARG